MGKLYCKNWPLAVQMCVMMTLVVIVVVLGVTFMSIVREQNTFKQQIELEAGATLNTPAIVSTDPLAATIASMRTQALVVAMAAIVFTMMVVPVVSHLIMRPLKKLARATSGISGGDLDQRLGVLAHAFNDMSTRLHEALARLRDEIEEHKRAEEKLAEERGLLRTLIESLPDCVYVKDTHSRVIAANTAHLQMLGVHTLEEVVGKTDFNFYPPERAEEYCSDEQEIMRSGNPLLDRVESVTNHSANKKWFLTSKVPFRDSQGSIAGLVAISRDITALKEAEERLQRTADELAYSNRELEQFAYVASHDLQEPLRAVAGFTQLLERRYKGKLDSNADEFIEYILDGIKRMQVMINDLLSYSRVGTRGKDFAPVDCEVIFAQAVENLRMVIDEKNVAITHDPLPVVIADDTQLVQLLQNLISNGIKFCDKDAARIYVSAREEGNDWIFSVCDNGIGIDPQYFDRIFVIFQRLHNREDYDGSGIGLAICSKIVERHGGRIWVESKSGEGSTFYFALPKKGGINDREPAVWKASRDSVGGG